MNEIKVFINEDFGEIRAMDINGQPWFVGKDIATVLGYKDTSDALKRHVDEDDKGVGVLPTPGGNQNVIMINESGLYSLILSSKLPNAKKFKRWVTSEVLPEIRMYGGYIPGNSGPEVIANGMTVMDNKVGLIDNTEYIKAYIEKNEREIREREPQFRLHPYNPVRFVVLGNFIGWDVYKQITMEQLKEVMYKIRFIFDNDNITYLNPAKVYRLSKYKDEILLTPAGFKELYYYFSDSKLKYVMKDVDYEELRLQGEKVEAEFKRMQDVANSINNDPNIPF